MAYTSLPTVVPGDPVRASWGNQVDTDLDDLDSRVTDLETALGSPGPGLGDVTGPVSSTDNAIPRFDGTGGVTLQNSGITIADAATGTLAGSNSGDVTLSGVPTYLTLAAQVLTRALIDLASHVTGRLPFANLTAATAANRLLGRGSTSGAGDFEEIALGAGLTLSGSTLSAPGGGGPAALDDLTDTIITTPTTNDVLHYNGSEWVNEDTPQLVRVGIAVAADSSAKLKIAGQYGATTYDAGNSGSAKTLDWDNSNTQLVTMTASCTFTLSNPKDGFRYLLVLKQGGAGSFTATWPSAVKWPAGTAPTLSTTVGKCDIVTLVYCAGLGASGNYLAAANTDYTPA